MLSNLLYLAAFFASPTTASWRMRCADFPGAFRIDPIDSPGVASKHAHLIHGGVNFGMTTSYENLRASNCSTCQVAEDKSAYWVPSLHFQHSDGTFEAVPQIGGIAVYYFLRSGFEQESVEPFPPGFRMIAGDSRQRAFPWPVPDPPTSFWNETDFTQAALRQKALGFNCLHYNNPPNENTLFRHFLPDKTFLENNCYSGIRIELVFPSCWNGKDFDSADHKSHVAYPNFVQSGKCPPDYPVRLPTLLYEVIFDTQKFKGTDGTYVFSNGDTTGFGNHGDFYSGWDPAFLKQAIEQCTDSFSDITKCNLFHLKPDDEFNACATQFEPAPVVAKENCAARRPSLCGSNVKFGSAPQAPSTPDVPAPAPYVAPPVVAPAPVPLPAPPASPAPPAPTPPAVLPPSPPGMRTVTEMRDGKLFILYEVNKTITEDVTTTIYMKRHAHHAREHGQH